VHLYLQAAATHLQRLLKKLLRHQRRTRKPTPSCVIGSTRCQTMNTITLLVQGSAGLFFCVAQLLHNVLAKSPDIIEVFDIIRLEKQMLAGVVVAYKEPA